MVRRPIETPKLPATGQSEPHAVTDEFARSILTPQLGDDVAAARGIRVSISGQYPGALSACATVLTPAQRCPVRSMHDRVHAPGGGAGISMFNARKECLLSASSASRFPLLDGPSRASNPPRSILFRSLAVNLPPPSYFLTGTSVRTHARRKHLGSNSSRHIPPSITENRRGEKRIMYS